MFKQRPYIPVALMVGAWVLIAVVAWQLSGSRSTQAASARTDQPVAATYRGTLPVAHFDVSPPLRDMKIIPPALGKLRANEDRERERQGPNLAQPADPVVQRLLGGLSPFVMPTPIISFDGPNNTCGCSPPDPNGEVGPNHYVVMTNLSFQIYNKTGTSLFGPAQNNTLWAGFGGACQTENAGDPVVLYDQLADRWLLSQFTANGPTYYNCVALSQTADPTGAYYRYAFTTGTNFPDYPKYGMFPDAYYISTREFAGNPFAGVGAYAANRVQMLAGNPNPTVISFLAPPNPAYNVGDGLLPADLDGTTLPPAGGPEYYVGSMDDNGPYGAPQDAYTLWKFTADFVNPPSSSFVLANTLTAAAFNTNFPCGTGRQCIPQPGTTNKLDMLASRQRPLFLLAYRNMGSYESLVSNISVDAGVGPAGDTAGIRWFELRSPNSSPTIYQQGTYAPGLTDSIHRWMGSIAMDTQGNMALGYSASSTTLFPSIRYTGRLAGDPLGTMPQGEASLIEGTGSQTGSNRWGDYSDMTVDPVDDCTFWYVHEYVPTTSSIGYRMRIGSFKFPQCAQGTPTPTVTGTPPTATRTATPTNTVPATATSTATATVNPCLLAPYTIATGTATVVPATTLLVGSNCDDCEVPLPLPFPITLYGSTFSSGAQAGSNGVLSFGTINDAFTNTCQPSANATYELLPYWDDLDASTCSGCGIYTSVLGVAPNRTFLVEWRTQTFSGAVSTNFEVAFAENTPGNFLYIYGATQGGTGATIGVQRNATGFTQFSCNTASVSTGLLLLFSQPPCATPTVGPSNTPTAPPTSTATATSAATHTATPTATATSCPVQFVDVPVGSTFYDYVRCLACRGIVGGYPCGGPGEPCPGNYYRPNNNVTRGQTSKIVSESAGFANVIPSTQQTFEDVPPGSTFYLWIERLAGRGIIGGYPCGGPFEPCVSPGNRPYFRPGNNVTRGQLSKITAGAAGWTETPTSQTFQDAPPGSTFYVYIERMASRGIISGYACGSSAFEPCVAPGNRPYFRPNNNATRGQMAKIAAAAFFPNCQTPVRR